MCGAILSECKGTKAEEANARAVAAHSNGLAIFPLSHSTITEFLKREVTDDSRAQAYLMDRLSDSVTLRNGQHIRDLEALGTYELIMNGETRPAGIDHMFTAAICHSGDVGFEFPEPWSERSADAFVRAVLDRGLPGISYLQITDRLESLLRTREERDVIYVQHMESWRDDARAWASDRGGKLNANRLRVEEYTFAVRRHLIARLARLLSDHDLRQLTERIVSLVEAGEVTTLAAIVSTMPTVELSCEMHVQSALNARRAPGEQDFYDHEHAVVAIPRVHAFVTSDRGLLDLLRRCRLPATRPCRLLRGLDGLASYLVALDRYC